ncbi:MAG: glycosyltransferase family 1 protein [Chamaesiphon sp.]
MLINLSFLSSKPTGITTYATNLFPYLQPLNPTLLISQNLANYNCYPVPSNLTPDQGTAGHFRRLLWTQLQLPQIYHQLKSSLLFSPIPEAPLFSTCRYVVMVHDLIPLRFPKLFSPLTSYCRYWLPQVLTQAQHIFCHSNATAQDITKFFNIRAEKITPTLLGYDAAHFRFLNLPTSNYFLYIGRHDPYKNLERLIAAFAASPQRPDRELWLAGPSDRRYTPALLAQVEQLSLTSQIKFLDYVPYTQLPTLINQAIALVFPSLWEGFGLPVLEAMACGTPVITSNLSSIPEVAGDAAILVNPYSVGEIAEAMQAIAETAGLRSHLRQAGLARANQFSWAKTGKVTVEVLQQYL